MNTASLENCKRLYELSGWLNDHPTQGIWVEYPDGVSMLWASPTPEHPDEVLQTTPAYGFDYIWRRLPAKVGEEFIQMEKTLADGIVYIGTPRVAGVSKFGAVGKPADAACELLIQLIEQHMIEGGRREDNAS